ncbi:GNAT family N-acetyltransferase [Candidatus Lokiarchaeum ossiferum]|uniref:GNAT family N-acetyltransferase n=1 Tax=Candidatus Lokiarchaeum ossiferum TaxID=2951803 RepID=UPI00352F44B0
MLNNLVIRPVKPNEIEAVELCINRSFSKDPDNPCRQDFFQQFDYVPRQREEFFWGAFLDNKPVAGLLLIPFHIMLWYCPLHLVCMTGVGTDPKYRHQGIAKHLINHVHSAIQNEGFDGIVLHSAADELYQKLGYETSFSEWNLRISWTYSAKSTLRTLMEKKVSTGKYVEFFMEHELTESVSEEMYWVRHRSTQFVKRPIRCIRNPIHFHQKLLQHLNNDAILATIYSGRDIRAYALARYDGNNLRIFEQYSLMNDPDDFLLLWQALLEEYNSPSLVLEIKTYPTDTEVFALGKKFKCSVERNLDTKNMAILFHPGVILPWMQTTFCQRVANSTMVDLQDKFLLQIENSRFLFRITREIVSVNEIDLSPTSIDFTNLPIFQLTKKQWIALTFGYKTIEDIFDEIIPIGKDAEYEMYKPILNILYPDLNPVWDYFEPL